MTNEKNLCLGCDFINDGKWCEYFRQVTIYRDSCEGFRPKATEESNSSSMACYVSVGWVTRIGGRVINYHKTYPLADAEQHCFVGGGTKNSDVREIFIKET